MMSTINDVDYAFVNHTITTYYVTDVSECMKKCLLNPNCYSFNYGYDGEVEKMCELNNVTRAINRNCFVPRFGYVYYE